MTAPVEKPPRSDLPIAVIGGGATGLAAAYRLVKLGRRVRLFEAASRLGGSVRSEQTDGWLIEAGPNTMLQNSREVAELIRELGLEEKTVVANSAAKKRFIVRNGQLCGVPTSPGAFFRTPLFSFGSKLKLLAEPLSRPRRRISDVSLATLVGDHFGEEVVDYALNPFVSGVYAGNPEKLSARHAFPKLWESEQKVGSLIRGQFAQAKERKAAGHPRSQIISFQNGLQVLTDALAHALPSNTVELDARVESLLPGTVWRVIWSRNGTTHTEEFSRVILAVPAAALARLPFGALGERPLALFEGMEYPPVTSLFLGFRREHILHPLDGFGALVPAKEDLPLLGVLFSSTLFPARAPEGRVALTVMVGGALRPALASKSMDEITASVMPVLDQLLGVRADPAFRRVHFWPHAIPQYQLGHERFLDCLQAAERQYPGLHIGGSVRDGIALPACLQSGLKVASEAAGR